VVSAILETLTRSVIYTCGLQEFMGNCQIRISSKDRAMPSSGKASDLYSGGTWLEISAGNYPEDFRGFPQPPLNSTLNKAKPTSFNTFYKPLFTNQSSTKNTWPSDKLHTCQ